MYFLYSEPCRATFKNVQARDSFLMTFLSHNMTTLLKLRFHSDNHARTHSCICVKNESYGTSCSGAAPTSFCDSLEVFFILWMWAVLQQVVYFTNRKRSLVNGAIPWSEKIIFSKKENITSLENRKKAHELLCLYL